MLKSIIMNLAIKLGFIKIEKLKEQELKDKFCSMIKQQMNKAATVKLSDYDYDYINKQEH